MIASIGRPCLTETLDDISNSSMLPNEVIIVLPKNSEFVLPDSYEENGLNIRLLYGQKGQVKQRQVGLLHCKYDIIIQLDDDIRFDSMVLHSLVHEVSNNSNIIVSPLFYDLHANLCISGTKVGQNRFLKFLYGTNAEKEALGVGYVSSIGLAIRPSSLKDRNLIRSEWLPGGCMSYHKKFSTKGSKILSPDGKFYGEDLINSHIMREMGAELFFATKLGVRAEVISVRALKDAITHFKSMIFIQQMNHGKIFFVKTLLFCLIRYVRSWLLKSS